MDSEYFLIDVGESAKLHTRIENHDKKDCWIKNVMGNWVYMFTILRF